MIKCVVSRGGRPDLVPVNSLAKITVPTCFIIGGNDFEVIKMNQRAHDELASKVKEFKTVPNATHLFEETGTLGIAAEIAAKFLVNQFITGNEE
jgi:putative phosphoribosyl transferase